MVVIHNSEIMARKSNRTETGTKVSVYSINTIKGIITFPKKSTKKGGSVIWKNLKYAVSLKSGRKEFHGEGRVQCVEGCRVANEDSKRQI